MSKKMTLKLGDKSYPLNEFSIEFGRYSDESGELIDSIYGGYLSLRVAGTADSQLLRLAADEGIGTDGMIVFEDKNEMPISFTNAKMVSFFSSSSYSGKPIVNLVLKPDVLDIMGIEYIEKPFMK